MKVKAYQTGVKLILTPENNVVSEPIIKTVLVDSTWRVLLKKAGIDIFILITANVWYYFRPCYLLGFAAGAMFAIVVMNLFVILKKL